MPAPDGIFESTAETTLFGFEATPASVRVQARSTGWRVGMASGTFLLVVGIASPLVVFPPHAVWLLGGLGTGAFLGHRRFIEHFTLLSAAGCCPKCGLDYTLGRTRLRVPHPVPCPGCNHEGTLRLPAGTLEAHARD